MFCRNCATDLSENAYACTKCGQRPLDGNKFCSKCGKETQEKAVVCVTCGAALPTLASTGEKPPVVAVLLNLLWAGVGNIYLGQKTKGIVLGAVTFFLLFLVFASCGFGTFLFIPYQIAMAVDAALIAGRINKGESVDEWKFF